MATYLWTGSEKFYPAEYQDLILCRDIYHCLPSQLANEDFTTVQLHLAFISAEQENERLRKAKPTKSRGRKKKGG